MARREIRYGYYKFHSRTPSTNRVGPAPVFSCFWCNNNVRFMREPRVRGTMRNTNKRRRVCRVSASTVMRNTSRRVGNHEKARRGPPRRKRFGKAYYTRSPTSVIAYNNNDSSGACNRRFAYGRRWTAVPVRGSCRRRASPGTSSSILLTLPAGRFTLFRCTDDNGLRACVCMCPGRLFRGSSPSSCSALLS